MPWNKKDIMSLREELAYEAKEHKASISELSKKYNISRPTVYKWINRFANEGKLGLIDRSRRPTYTPVRTDDEVVNWILKERKKYPSWGARKLRQLLINQGHPNIPCESTINRILQRHNLINDDESEKRKHWHRFEKEKPNELWQMDFKGNFPTAKERCHPLTILDDCSRFSLCLKACAGETEEIVKEALEETFDYYGLPDAMTMDNGPPWKGAPGSRLSRITVWLMRLGIRVGHSRPFHPQTQGKGERFHRSFKEEVLKYHNFDDLVEAQNHFDNWRAVYNNIRPHEALKMKSPVDIYRKSDKKFTGKLAPIEYLKDDVLRKVKNNGDVNFLGKVIFIGQALGKEEIAFRFREPNKWDIYYCQSRLGIVTQD